MTKISEPETGKPRIACDDCATMAPPDSDLLKHGGLNTMGWDCKGGTHKCPTCKEQPE